MIVVEDSCRGLAASPLYTEPGQRTCFQFAGGYTKGSVNPYISGEMCPLLGALWSLGRCCLCRGGVLQRLKLLKGGGAVGYLGVFPAACGFG